MHFPMILGLIAGTLTTAALIPQLHRLLKTRSAKDISVAMYIVMTIGVALWLTYGIVIADPAIIITNSASLLLASTNLFLMLRYKSKRA